MTRFSSLLANLRLLGAALARRSGRQALRLGFDRAYYRSRYPDVAASRWPAFPHYLHSGYREFRDPSPSFSTSYYLRRHDDVFQAGVCPLVHYAAFGRAEGRAWAAAEPVEAPVPPSGPPPAPWPPEQPLVSVVIPCFNYGRFLGETLASVQRQTFRDFEILVVEGGSTDPASHAEVQRIECSRAFDAQFLYRQQPARAGDNRNYGIQRARGKYICCLDADDRLLPTFLETAVFLAESGDYDIVSPSLRMFGLDGGTWHASAPSLEGLSLENTLTSASLFRRDVWQSIGGFRDFGLGDAHAPEDWDFWLRALAAGFRAAALAAPLYEYRVHDASLSARANPSTYAQRIRQANPRLLSHASPPRPRTPPAGPCANLHRLPPPPAPPGVLLCLPWITAGGAERLLAAIFGPLRAAGLPVAAVTTGHLKPRMTDESACFERLDIPVYPLPELFSGGSWAPFLLALARRIRAGHLFLCGSEYAYTQLAALRAALPGLRAYDQLFNGEGHLRANRAAAPSLDLTLVPSEALRRLLVQDLDEAPHRVRVIRHGLLPATSIASAEPLPEAFRGKLLITFAGRLAPEKDPCFFVDLAAQLAADPRLAFLLLGDGPDRAAVEKSIARHRLQDRILRPGAVDDIRPYLALSAAVVVPSRVDGMPNVVLEAMAAGVPVVAAAVGGIPEMVLHQETGFLCPPGDLASFAAHLCRLSADDALRAAQGAAARLRVSSAFDFEATLAAYRGLFGLS